MINVTLSPFGVIHGLMRKSEDERGVKNTNSKKFERCAILAASHHYSTHALSHFQHNSLAFCFELCNVVQTAHLGE